MTGGRGRGDHKSKAQGSLSPLRAAEKWGVRGAEARGEGGWAGQKPQRFQAQGTWDSQIPSHNLPADIAANRTGNIPA